MGTDRHQDVKIPDRDISVMDVTALSETIDYGLPMLGIPETWNVTKGHWITVGILDTGLARHDDLEGVLTLGPMDIDTNGHGTHVAGIIGARANAIGVCGVAPEATLVCGKVSPGSWADVASGIQAMIARGCDVINMSFGGYNPPTQGVLDAFEACYQAGVVCVASAGNLPADQRRDHAKDTITYPARCPHVIPVAAIDVAKAAPPFTVEGEELARGFAMPGVRVLSTWLNNQYARVSGTSMAAPFLTGIIALMLSKHDFTSGSKTPIPKSGPGRVDAVIEHLREAAVTAGDPSVFGYGYIDARKI